jgi:hypothetical protein
MTKHKPAPQSAIAMSPYLTLRRAVRPLIFAHALLEREQERAGKLAAECATLVQLTQELLETVGLVHLLDTGGVNVPAAYADESRQSLLTEAYAKAGLMWAQITGSAIALGGSLIDAGRWDDVHRLAGFLEESGEKFAAEDLRTRAISGRLRVLESRLAEIHPSMTESEISSAIEVLRESRSGETVSIYIRPLALSILRMHPPDVDFSARNIYSHDTATITGWLASEGDCLHPGQPLMTLNATKYPSGAGYKEVSFSGFWSILVRRLVPEGREIKTSTVVARLIRASDEINAVLKEPVNVRNIFAQLDTLARIFGRIQVDHRRPSAGSA